MELTRLPASAAARRAMGDADGASTDVAAAATVPRTSSSRATPQPSCWRDMRMAATLLLPALEGRAQPAADAAAGTRRPPRTQGASALTSTPSPVASRSASRSSRCAEDARASSACSALSRPLMALVPPARRPQANVAAHCRAAPSSTMATGAWATPCGGPGGDGAAVAAAGGSLDGAAAPWAAGAARASPERSMWTASNMGGRYSSNVMASAPSAACSSRFASSTLLGRTPSMARRVSPGTGCRYARASAATSSEETRCACAAVKTPCTCGGTGWLCAGGGACTPPLWVLRAPATAGDDPGWAPSRSARDAALAPPPATARRRAPPLFSGAVAAGAAASPSPSPLPGSPLPPSRRRLRLCPPGCSLRPPPSAAGGSAAGSSPPRAAGAPPSSSSSAGGSSSSGDPSASRPSNCSRGGGGSDAAALTTGRRGASRRSSGWWCDEEEAEGGQAEAEEEEEDAPAPRMRGGGAMSTSSDSSHPPPPPPPLPCALLGAVAAAATTSGSGVLHSAALSSASCTVLTQRWPPCDTSGSASCATAASGSAAGASR